MTVTSKFLLKCHLLTTLLSMDTTSCLVLQITSSFPFITSLHVFVHVCACAQLLQLCPILWTIALQAPLPMGFPRQEYWSGLPFSPPSDLPNPGIELTSLMSSE